MSDVTRPTGSFGQYVVQHLLDAVDAVPVIVRHAGKLPQAFRDRAEIVQGSHRDAVVVSRAFDGAEAVFWVASPNPSATLDDNDVPRPAVDAARHYGVARVVMVQRAVAAPSGRTRHAASITRRP